MKTIENFSLLLKSKVFSTWEATTLVIKEAYKGAITSGWDYENDYLCPSKYKDNIIYTSWTNDPTITSDPNSNLFSSIRVYTLFANTNNNEEIFVEVNSKKCRILEIYPSTDYLLTLFVEEIN